jgi:hypothetical protein
MENSHLFKRTFLTSAASDLSLAGQKMVQRCGVQLSTIHPKLRYPKELSLNLITLTTLYSLYISMIYWKLHVTICNWYTVCLIYPYSPISSFCRNNAGTRTKVAGRTSQAICQLTYERHQTHVRVRVLRSIVQGKLYPVLIPTSKLLAWSFLDVLK